MGLVNIKSAPLNDRELVFSFAEPFLMIFFDSESIFSKGFEHFRIYDIEIFYSIFRMIKSGMALDKSNGFWQKLLPIYQQKQMQKYEKINHILIKCVGHWTTVYHNTIFT